MNVGSIASTLYKKLGPEVKVDHGTKTVEIRERYIFATLTEAFYILKYAGKGYQVKRV